MGICSIEIVYALVIMIGQMNYGCIMCYPSPTSTEIQNLHHLDSDSLAWSFYNSVSSLTAIGGSFLASGLLKWLHESRKKSTFIISAMGIAFWLLNCLTKVSIWAGIVTRALLGIVMGAYTTIGPMYLVEIAPAGLNGLFGTFNQISFVIGLLFFDFIGPSLDYMKLNYVGAAVSALQVILIWFIKESPIATATNDENPNNNNNQDQEKEKISDKRNVMGLLLGIAVYLLQQFCGINAILTNIEAIMNESGLKMNGSYQGGIATCAQLVSVIISAFIIDKIGRKVSYIVSNSLIVISLLIFALNTKYDWSTVLPLIMIFIFQFGYGLGMGPIPPFIVPDYFHPSVRPIATAIIVAVSWLFAFVIIFIWPLMKKGMGMFGSLLLFMCVSIVAIVFGLFLIKENKVENIEEEDESERKHDIFQGII